MAHFARLDQDDRVIEVLVVTDDVLDDGTGTPSEAAGERYLQGLCGTTDAFVRTSYSGLYRGAFAGIDDYYDRLNDIFIREGEFQWN